MNDRRFARVTAVVMVVAVAFTLVFTLYPDTLGLSDGGVDMPYEAAVFDRDGLMTVNIQVPEADWQGLLDNAQAEEYITADITVNGATIQQVGIRCKGNSSLRMAGSSQRYSFKVQFDEYITGQTLLGLDKMVFNNMQGDATWMKEYLAYYTMDMIGVNVPLYAFARIYVNGEYWGLYLALETLEDSYAMRNYGTNYGNLYKVESMDMGNTESQAREWGGEGGFPVMGGFEMPEGFEPPGGFEMPGGFGMPGGAAGATEDAADPAATDAPAEGVMPSGGAMPEGFSPSDGFTPPDGAALPAGNASNEAPWGLRDDDAPPTPTGEGDAAQPTPEEPSDETAQDFFGNLAGRMGGGGGGFMMFSGQGGADLAYIDDAIDSYSSIFSNTIFPQTTKQDRQRVIAALRGISDETTDIADYVDVDQMLRYIAGNAAVGNGDGFFGSMLHNYYLYEKHGKITMLPWDYNLAYGGFMGSASQLINLSIDDPFLSGTIEDRPIIRRLLEEEDYRAIYYGYIREIGVFYADGGAAALIDSLDALIRDWVDADPTKEYTLDAYDAGVEMLKEYVALRGQSMLRQLDGDTTAVDTSAINLGTMGSMGGGMGGFGGRDNMDGGMRGGRGGMGQMPAQADGSAADAGMLDVVMPAWMPGGAGAQAEGAGTIADVDAQVWWTLGSCVALLLVAIAIAARGRRRRRYFT